MDESAEAMGRTAIRETVTSTVEEFPVSLAILFGSHATETTHPTSDIDIAVELEGLRPGDGRYNDTFLGLSAAIAEAFGTDDVDVVDVHSLPPAMARSVLTDGHLLVGDPGRIETLRRQLPPAEEARSSVSDRFDERLRRIEELLG